MHMQVITIGTDGRISGLQVKPGRGVDIRQFNDRADVKRASEIVATSDGQAWFIDVLQEAGRGVVRAAHLRDVGVPVNGFACTETPSGLLTFPDYDEAVRCEIAYLDALRLRGLF
jgi:hypothetical protein